MALEEFDKEELTRKEKGYALMKSIMDYGMGVLWLGMGIVLIFSDNFGLKIDARFNDPALKAFAVVCIVYGLFRFYRGYKKNYFKER